jgi:hypothetical protein
MNHIENSHIDRTLMNKLIMNYLVNGKLLFFVDFFLFLTFKIKEGFKEAADKFRTETGVYYPYDSVSLDGRIRIRESIEIGNINEAIDLVNKFNPELMDNNRFIAFHLQVFFFF